MRYKAPDDIKGKELFDYLIKHKSDIIQKKRSQPIYSEVITASEEKKEGALVVSKAHIEKASAMPDFGESFTKSVIGNLAGWMDTYDDVSMRGSFNRTVNNNAKMMYFLKDHGKASTDIIASLKGVSVENINLASLGIEGNGLFEQEAIVFTGEFDIRLDPKAYYLYYYDMAKQHSIGLQYVRISLAVNDADLKEEYKTWVDNIGQVINQDKAVSKGYFWAVEEQRVFENSLVLWGANDKTPVLLDSNISTSKHEPAQAGTSKERKSDASLFMYNILNKSR